MRFPVLLDACVLVPYPLCDLLLRLADADMYRPLWSAQILDEVERTLINRMGVSPAKARRRLDQMRSAFPTASVEGYQDLVPAMTNDPKDRHVLAAAVRARAGDHRDSEPVRLPRGRARAVRPRCHPPRRLPP